MRNNSTIFKGYILASLIVLNCYNGNAQLTNGGLHANFGVDADTKADYVKYGTTTGHISSEDWFSTSNASRGVIDTSNKAYYKNLLMNNQNIAFVKKMSAPLYTKWNNALWLDAVYCRDYVKLDGDHLDSTSFISSAKNAGDPATWLAGPGSVSTKNDLLDVYTHMRRNGLNISDSLWLFTAASTVGTNGSRYYDIELFKNSFSFDAATGRFSSPGPDDGHTQWIFDAAGNVTQTGDLIIAITYNPGAAPIIEVRIWVSRTSFNSVTPRLFRFNGLFDANTNSAPFGYASIVTPTGSTAFGSGAGNYSATASDTTYSTPWGTTTSVWNANYQPLQLVEIGINLTRIGLDPSVYSSLRDQACGSFFKSIFYKSRSSASFSSALNDFVGPLDFMSIPVLDHEVRNDTISCRRPVVMLRATSNTTAALYQWKTPQGITVTAPTLPLNRPGQYILESSIAAGCGVGRTDTLVVLADTLKPVASANLGANGIGQLQLFGGDPVASNYSTPFGGSKGLSYAWTGPLAFASILQNPLINIPGPYSITVTELRNGCRSTANVQATLFLLSGNRINLKGTTSNKSVMLKWNNQPNNDVIGYEVERSIPGNPFEKLTMVPVTSWGSASFTYVDHQPGSKKNIYRVREIRKAALPEYSNIVSLQASIVEEQFSFTLNKETGKLYLRTDASSDNDAAVAIYNLAGNLLFMQKIHITKGAGRIEIDANRITDHGMKLATVYIGNQPVYTAKLQP